MTGGFSSGSTPNLAAVLAKGGNGGGGSITNTPISGSTGAFTSLSVSGNIDGAAEVRAPGITVRGGGTDFITLSSLGPAGTFCFLSAGLVNFSVPANNILRQANGTADQTLILGSPSGTGGGVLVLHQSASAPTPSAQDAMFYSLLGEGYGMDGSGNQTLLTPHATDAPAALYEDGPGADHIERKVNVYLATVKFWNVDRERHLHAQHLVSVGFGPAGSAEESLAAWTEVAARRASGRLLCEHEETFAEYKTRTGNSLVPAGQDEAWWMARAPAERWQKVESDRVAKSQEAIDAFNVRKAAFPAILAAWAARRDAFVPNEAQATFAEPEPTFTETEPALYVAAPTPAFLL